jgi:hypothetical protein
VQLRRNVQKTCKQKEHGTNKNELLAVSMHGKEHEASKVKVEEDNMNITSLHTFETRNKSERGQPAST